MSAIAGIFYFDRRAVEKDELERIIDNEIIAKRGSDSKGIWFDGPIGLAQRAFWTTPEQTLETQPLTDKNTGLTLVMDGRVDNRFELIHELKARGINTPIATDAEIVLFAYHLWQEECPHKIIGDFAFAIWDSKRQKLFCARDALGIRPFYYYKSEQFIAFASEAQALFEHPEIPKKPDLDSMAIYLVSNLENSSCTEFSKVFKLRPAHSMTVTTNSLSIKQYWDINTNHVLKLKTIHEYCELFLETLTTTIKNQLRCNGSIGVMFSGGVDSSSLLCLIEELKLKGEIKTDISAYSVAFDGGRADEREYMKLVQKQCGTEINWIYPKPPYPLWEVPYAIHSSQALWNTEATMLTKPLFEQAANDNKKVILTGMGGDEFLDVSIYWAIDLMLQGKLLQVFKFINSYTQYVGASVGLVMKLVISAPFEPVRTMLPIWFKKLYRIISPITVYNWLQNPYRERLFERLRQKPWYLSNKTFKSFSKQDTYSAIYNGYRISGIELLDRLAASVHTIEVRHPFCDRRLVELVSSIPENFLVYKLQPKGLLRVAMQSKLPQKIENRMDKGDFTSLINTLLIYSNRNAAKKLLADSYLDEIGLIDKKKAIKAYDDYCNNYANNLNNSYGSDIMWQIISLEYWARHNFDKMKTHGGIDNERRKITV